MIRRAGGRSRRPRVEHLESRRLMAVTYQAEFIPNTMVPATFDPNGVLANAITVGPDGNLWFSISAENDNLPQGPPVGMLNPSTGAYALYPTPYGQSGNPDPNHIPSSIVSGPDGDLWLIDASQYSHAGYYIDAVDPTTGAVTPYPISTPNAVLAGLAVGSDGNLWFTDSANDAIGMFDPTTHASVEYPLPNTGNVPALITPGPNGDLFFTADLTGNANEAIGEIDPTTHAITLAALPNSQAVPTSITAGPDGNVWFNETIGMGGGTSYKIGMLDPSTHAITEFAGGSSGGITTGPDGDLWYDGQGDLTQFDPTTHVATSFPLPAGVTVPAGGPTIVTEPDGTLAFTAQNYIVSAQIVPADESAITGSVDEDPTGSGTTDNPLTYPTVYLDLNDDDMLDPGDPTARTDGLGNYVFSGLEPGTYTVRVAPYPGIISTFPTGGGQAVTVAAGQVGTAGPLGIIPSSSILPLTYGPNPFGAANPDVQTAEVNGLYEMILGRAPDPAGGANALAYLKSGGSLANLAGFLLTCPEHDTDLVKSDYENYLDRAPTGTELSAGVALLQGGDTPEQFAATLFNSAEFSTLFATDTAFVQQLYIDILGRAADTPGLATWVGALGDGMTRADVVAKFLDSPESASRASSGQSDIILGVVSTTKANDIAFLQTGASQFNLAVGNFASPGFVTRANTTVT